MIKTAIATVVKDETEYIEDFIKYHLDLGINEIHIFEDYGSISHKLICDKYQNVFLKSILDIFPIEQKDEIIQMRKNKIPPQTLFINQMLKYLHQTHNEDWWVFLTDIDEYITSTEAIPDVLERFNDREAVLVYWKNFGCSKRIYKPKYDKPIYEIYTQPCGYELFSDGKFYKITKFCVNLNKWKEEHKYWIHNAPRNWIKADGTFKRTEIVYEPLYLRHYITKSVEEFIFKLYKRGMMHPNHRSLQSLKEMCPVEYDMANNEEFKHHLKEKYGIELKW